MTKILLTLISAVALAASINAGVIFSDAFSYSDGGIVTNSAGIWVPSTGTANSMLVSNQQLVVSTSRTEDITGSLGSTYMTNGSTPALYASFTLKCNGLPTSSGAYFAHFVGANTFGALSGHRARVWAGVTNVTTGLRASTGNFLLSILNTTNNPIAAAQWPNELASNVTYTIIVKYDLATMVSTLWVDPVTELSPSITGTDFPADLYDVANGVVNISSYSYRQATGEGTMWIDNLKVGTTFGDAAGLSPLPTTPIIYEQPHSGSYVLGTNVTLTVLAFPINAVSYQWRKDGLLINDATNTTLALTNLILSDAGNYDVDVTNIYGAAISSKAVVQVLPTNAPVIRVNNILAVGTVAVATPASLTITGGFSGGLIFYTVDGNPPTVSSTLYSGAFSLTNSATVRAMSLSADFSQTSEAPAINLVVLPGYTLTTSVSGSGSISLNPPTGPYVSNSVVSLTAFASPNWAFNNWSGDLAGSSNPASITMNASKSVQAVFVPSAYPLTLTTPGGGSVTANGSTIAANTYYPTSSIVSLQATPSSGWSFIRWQGTSSSTSNPFNLSMTQTQNVQAVFGTVVATNISGSGSVVMSETNPVPFGTVLTNTAVPGPGYYFVTWTGALSGTNNPATFTVNTATPSVGALFALSSVLTIVRQPTNTSVVLGNSANLNLEATGTAPLTYQWRKGGANIGGATGTNYNIPSALASDAGNYDVVVMNGVGGSLTSSVATLTVLLPPTISQPPQSQFVIIGSNTTFSVTAAGTPTLNYQWRKGGVNIGGAVATNYSLTSVTTNDGAGYDVVVTNPYGSITSGVATLTVVFPPSITTQPTNQLVASGNSTSFSVTADGTPSLNYQWHNGAGPILAATNSTYLLNPATTNDAGGYFAIVSNAYCQATSAVATLTVFIPASINSGPFSQLVAAHDTATFSVGAFGYPALSYQWLFNGADIPGANSSSLVITNVGTNHLGNYWVEAWNIYSAVTSTPAALLMSPSLQTPFAGLVGIWGRETTLSVSAWGSGNLSYQWYKDGVLVSGATNGSLVFPAVQFGDGGLYSVVVNSPYGSITNTPAQLVINPANISLGLYAGITIEGVAGYTYGIEYTTDLQNTNSWQSLTNITLTQPVQIWADTSTNVLTSPKRFYRVTSQ